MFDLRSWRHKKNFSIKVIYPAGLLFLLFILSGCVPWIPIESSFHINLNKYPAYVKAGFDSLELSRGFDFSAEGWKVVPAENRKTPLKIKYLGLPDTPKRKYFSPFGEKDREYTLVIPFNVNAENYQEIRENTVFQPGIFFASLGDNWEVFLNGKVVRSELHLDEDGQILSHRTWRYVFFPLDKGLFTQGENLLVIRIVGAPDYDGTGIFYILPHYLDDYKVIEDQHDESFLITLCGIYIFMGLYYLLMFFRRPKERYSLYYGFFSFALGIYFLMRTSAVYNIIPNSSIVYRIEYLSLYMIIPMASAFLEYLNFGKTTKITKIFRGISLFLASTQLFFSQPYGDDSLRVWWISAFFGVGYILCFDIFYGFFRLIRERLRSSKNISLFKAIGISLIKTPLGAIFSGVIILIITGLLDIIRQIYWHDGAFYSSLYGFFLFTLLSTLILARRFAGLFRQLDHMNTVLEATVRKRTQELEHQTQLAESASQAKSAFLARMSHEIRTPLNAILGLSEVELQDELASKTRINLEKIYGSGSNLLEIINDILDISKIETGNFEVFPVEYEFLNIIGDTVQLNIVRIGTKPVKFILDLDEDIPCRLYGDELRLKQILNNLLSNAIKYTQQGEVRLEIRWERRSDGAWFVFMVKDTGRGIKREDIGKLFTEYTQLDVKANRRIEGTGLGLSITKGLVETMGGMIIVESEYQRGSTFQVRLPQGLVDDKPIGKEAAENLKNFRFYENRSRSRGGSLIRSYMPYGKVLVVDDVPMNLDVIKGLMMPYGLKVDTVSGGREAVELIRAGTEKYDLVFMDHMMPEMDGIEAVKIIREELGTEYARTVPIVVLTANAITGNRELFLENGFNDFISKPIDIKQLDMALNRWVRDKQSAETLKEAERQAGKQAKIR